MYAEKDLLICAVTGDLRLSFLNDLEFYSCSLQKPLQLFPAMDHCVPAVGIAFPLLKRQDPSGFFWCIS